MEAVPLRRHSWLALALLPALATALVRVQRRDEPVEDLSGLTPDILRVLVGLRLDTSANATDHGVAVTNCSKGLSRRLLDMQQAYTASNVPSAIYHQCDIYKTKVDFQKDGMSMESASWRCKHFGQLLVHEMFGARNYTKWCEYAFTRLAVSTRPRNTTEEAAKEANRTQMLREQAQLRAQLRELRAQYEASLKRRALKKYGLKEGKTGMKYKPFKGDAQQLQEELHSLQSDLDRHKLRSLEDELQHLEDEDWDFNDEDAEEFGEELDRVEALAWPTKAPSSFWDGSPKGCCPKGCSKCKDKSHNKTKSLLATKARGVDLFHTLVRSFLSQPASKFSDICVQQAKSAASTLRVTHMALRRECETYAQSDDEDDVGSSARFPAIRSHCEQFATEFPSAGNFTGYTGWCGRVHLYLASKPGTLQSSNKDESARSCCPQDCTACDPAL